MQVMIEVNVNVQRHITDSVKVHLIISDAFTAPINYYRHIVQYNESKPGNTRVPVLQLWGTRDKYLSMDSAHGSRAFVNDFEERYFPSVSHWVMMEAADEVNKIIEMYLKRRK
jgi:pimeloyl-ACP methyl ester carboxylesterase